MTFQTIVVGELETNCYILKFTTSMIIIDPGAEPDRIIEAVARTPVQVILATHRHYDHVDACAKVKKATRAQAMIHSLDWIPGFDRKLEDGQMIDIEGRRIAVIHTPGHTPGSCCFHINDIVFAGDTLFPDGHGNTSFSGGNQEAIMKSIREKLLTLPDETKVLPGHGPSTTIDRERRLYE